MVIKNKDFQIIKLAFLAVIASLGGWFVFKGVTHPSVFPIDNLSPIQLILIGLGISWIIFKIGLRKK